MASVVSGMVNAPAPLATTVVVGALAAEAAGACGGAALAAYCLTARDSAITETNGKSRMIQRIFMEQTSILAMGWNHTPGSPTPPSRCPNYVAPSTIVPVNVSQPQNWKHTSQNLSKFMHLLTLYPHIIRVADAAPRTGL